MESRKNSILLEEKNVDKKTMYDLLEELYERQQKYLKVFMLIDFF